MESMGQESDLKPWDGKGVPQFLWPQCLYVLDETLKIPSVNYNTSIVMENPPVFASFPMEIHGFPSFFLRFYCTWWLGHPLATRTYRTCAGPCPHQRGSETAPNSAHHQAVCRSSAGGEGNDWMIGMIILVWFRRRVWVALPSGLFGRWRSGKPPWYRFIIYKWAMFNSYVK